MNWIIKAFNELEVEELYDIITQRNDVFIMEQNCIYQDCDGKDKKSYHLYLEHAGEIIAYIRIVNKGVSYEEVSLGRVLVNRKHRGQEYGKDLMTKAIEFVEQTMGECAIRISAQSYLIRFYESFGFKVVSDEYMEDGIPHTEMLYLREDA
ncbi:GNAT family N-acetyltransferase [Desulfuribacillus alkaliarsenatis]|uniref:GNAT family N-acetyltransferase n=1 Tax=Desulfuribacillus alkaliarsenatis TaxID=766136 RepID=A0A1E5FZ39_9FIRM|nr:GNAT family N-acetyltransferase [Desulfuribacillus alkaliarsenatis]OEF95707.1 GNAT family N-acetyltransferase [Desulfuribacillus alkaliarsenatis]